jgi:hypothetical protein
MNRRCYTLDIRRRVMGRNKRLLSKEAFKEIALLIYRNKYNRGRVCSSVEELVQC